MPNKTNLITRKESSDMDTRELILELFKKDPTAIYRDQTKIAEAISHHLNVTRKQPAISKALEKISNRPIYYKGMTYHIIKIDAGYKLYKKQDVITDATQEFAERDVFESYKAYEICRNVIAYTVKEKHHNRVIDYMVKAFKEDTFFDIIRHGNMIYFILNPGTDQAKKVRELPEEVKAIKETNERIHPSKGNKKRNGS